VFEHFMEGRGKTTEISVEAGNPWQGFVPAAVAVCGRHTAKVQHNPLSYGMLRVPNIPAKEHF
jgi:hypothetical protein